MKTLIVYYSLSGNNKKVAQKLAEILPATIEEIVDLKKRKGIIGFLYAGRDAWFKRLTNINPPEEKPENFDLLIFCTPIWASRIAPAIRTYLLEQKQNIKKFAILSVSGGGEGNQKASRDFVEILNQKPIATLFLSDKELKTDDCPIKLKDFVEGLSKV